MKNLFLLILFFGLFFGAQFVYFENRYDVEEKINFDDISLKLMKIINHKIFLKYKQKKVNNLKQIERLNEFVRLKTKSLSVISQFK